MTLSRPHRGTIRRWLSTLAGVLVMVSQLSLAFAPLAETNGGRSLAAHTESQGATHLVYGHNEATCAACQARSVHGTSARVIPPFVAYVEAPSVYVASAVLAPRPVTATPTNPRAPPALI
jgi:cytochrome c553